jgi:hypothetical protein
MLKFKEIVRAALLTISAKISAADTCNGYIAQLKMVEGFSAYRGPILPQAAVQAKTKHRGK